MLFPSVQNVLLMLLGPCRKPFKLIVLNATSQTWGLSQNKANHLKCSAALFDCVAAHASVSNVPLVPDLASSNALVDLFSISAINDQAGVDLYNSLSEFKQVILRVCKCGSKAAAKDE